MPYRVTASDPTVRIDIDKAERRMAVYCKNNNITTDAQLDTVIDGLTSGQLATATRELLKALIRVGGAA